MSSELKQGGEELSSSSDSVRLAGQSRDDLSRSTAGLTGEYIATSQGATCPVEPLPVPLPAAFGRYLVKGFLGEGGFGRVYRGYDSQLDRTVAIKVSHAGPLGSADNVERFLKEARRLAQLKHPRIVVVHDVGVQDGHCYIISDFVNGTTLSRWLRDRRPAFADTAKIIAAVAEALAYAHSHRIVHRDVKPSNIILTDELNPVLVDFGLALSEDEMIGREHLRIVGTPAFMSPEQARGEAHRIDGRTDIYSLGVVMYRMLCGRLPFHSTDNAELRRQVREDEPQPPRQLARTIPRELERICLKAMAKRVSDRYSTAQDMAEDLRLVALGQAHEATKPPSGSAIPVSTGPTVVIDFSDSREIVRVVPKGLRSFGAEDSEFFLELLAGPRDRNGLPDAIRFWKARIESTNPEKSFQVGLIYAPSGAGKSSLVKAGLLPRLADSVLPVYVEATADDTEMRLAKAVARTCPDVDSRLSLPDLFAELRRGRGLPADRKLLIVLDQFEQWLHAHGQDMDQSALVSAMRQADGEHVQILLMVRDDFWMGISRLFDCLEINLNRERNARSVDLFDLRHTQRVLYLFGHAFDRLPVAAELTDDQKNFLEQAAEELSEDGRVIPVRVSLFAEMMKERPWSREALIEVGGTEGVGIRFLEETFTSRSALPDHRAFEKPARALLQSLLPERGVDIRGHMRSRQELAESCGVPENSGRFARLIEILDRELHLITPTERDEGQGSRVKSQSTETRDVSALDARFSTLDPCYQLTHDYLVPPLRHWLTLERRKTWRGRAELLLEERTGQMSRWPQSRYLPNVLEYLAIILGVPRHKRKAEQRALLREATIHYSIRGSIGAAAVLLLALVIFRVIASVRYESHLRETRTLVANLLGASGAGVPVAIERLRSQQDIAIPLLREQFGNSDLTRSQRLNTAMCLVELGSSSDSVENFLNDAVADAPAPECSNLVAALELTKDSAIAKLVERFKREENVETRIRYAIVLLQLGTTGPSEELMAVGSDPTARSAFILAFEKLRGRLETSLSHLATTGNSDLRSGLCSAIGLIPRDALTQGEFEQVSSLVQKIFVQAPDGGSHSAAAFALRKWAVDLPKIDSEPVIPTEADWFINKLEMAMIRVRPGNSIMGNPKASDQKNKMVLAHKVTLTRPYYMSDTEVTLGIFEQFINDPDYPDEKKPKGWKWPATVARRKPTHAVRGVSWEDAVLFCNWLSWKHGLEPCYEATESQETYTRTGSTPNPDGSMKPITIAVTLPIYKCDFEKPGYRLPTEAEWEFACRANSQTQFSFGDEIDLLPHFGVVQKASVPVGRLLPNAWGFFDMHGNVSEFCWDRLKEYTGDEVVDPTGPTDTPSFRARRGGSNSDAYEQCSSYNRSSLLPDMRHEMLGFRVVCGAAPANAMPGESALSDSDAGRN